MSVHMCVPMPKRMSIHMLLHRIHTRLRAGPVRPRHRAGTHARAYAHTCAHACVQVITPTPPAGGSCAPDSNPVCPVWAGLGQAHMHACTHACTCARVHARQCESNAYTRENCVTSCNEDCGGIDAGFAAGGSVPVPVVTPPAVPVPVVLPAPAIVPAPVQPCADLPDEAVAQQVTATGSRLSGCGEASEQGLCSAPIVAQGCPVSCGTCATPPIFVAPPSTEPIPNPPPAPSPAGGSAPVCTNYCQIGDGLLCKSFGWGEGSIDMRIVMCIDMYRHVCKQHRHCQHL